jgi:hypothetical protein
MSSTPLPAAIGALIRPPALTLLQIAVAASTGPDGEVDAETLALMARQVEEGLLDPLSPAEAWPALAEG